MAISKKPWLTDQLFEYQMLLLFSNNLLTNIWCSVSKSFKHVSDQGSNISEGL